MRTTTVYKLYMATRILSFFARLAGLQVTVLFWMFSLLVKISPQFAGNRLLFQCCFILAPERFTNFPDYVCGNA